MTYLLLFNLQQIAFSSEQEDRFRDVAKDLRCPTCTGLSVLDSDAPFSNQIKDAVRDKLNEGKSKDEILRFFTERYGPWILRSPPTQGFNLIAWILPFLLLVCGPLLIWALVWRKRRDTKAQDGVRSVEDIVIEFKNDLEQLRAARVPKDGVL